jgi:hydroxymethylbilane synthase
VKNKPISFGCLGSQLAKHQTQAVISRLQERHPRLTCQLTIVPSPIAELAKRDEPFLAAAAAEVQYLEQQLTAGEFRLVVMQAADLVLPLAVGVAYAAVPARDNPFDAFLNRRGLITEEMAPGSTVGVMNMGTLVQMRSLFPDLEFRVVTGGLDHALEQLLRLNEIDGLVLPAAAAEHLGIQGIVSEIFYPDLLLPSSGQGILIVLAREDDREIRDLLAELHSAATFDEMTAEHAFVQRLASDQDPPISVLAQREGQDINVAGGIGSPHGTSFNRATVRGPRSDAAQLGAAVVEKLLLDGRTVIDLLEADFPEGLPGHELESAPDDDDLDEDIRAELAELDIIPPPADDDR